MRRKPIRVNCWFTYRKTRPYFTGYLIDKDNDIAWFKNGDFHREDGPAIERADGSKHWFLNGKQLTEQEHRLKMRQMKIKLLDIDQHSL